MKRFLSVLLMVLGILTVNLANVSNDVGVSEKETFESVDCVLALSAVDTTVSNSFERVMYLFSGDRVVCMNHLNKQEDNEKSKTGFIPRKEKKWIRRIHHV